MITFPRFGAIIINANSCNGVIMRTFVVVTFSSEGGSASQVVNKLMDMGFETTLGSHDFVYHWDKSATAENVIELVDKVLSKLKGMNVLLQFATTQ